LLFMYGRQMSRTELTDMWDVSGRVRVKHMGVSLVIGEAAAEQQLGMGHRRYPRMIASLPCGHDAPQSEIEQLGRHLAGR